MCILSESARHQSSGCAQSFVVFCYGFHSENPLNSAQSAVKDWAQTHNGNHSSRYPLLTACALSLQYGTLSRFIRISSALPSAHSNELFPLIKILSFAFQSHFLSLSHNSHKDGKPSNFSIVKPRPGKVRNECT